jgi:hypothetical protein
MKVTREILTSISFEVNGSYSANFRRSNHKPTEVTRITYVGYGQPMGVTDFYFILKQKLLPPQGQIHTIYI